MEVLTIYRGFKWLVMLAHLSSLDRHSPLSMPRGCRRLGELSGGEGGRNKMATRSTTSDWVVCLCHTLWLVRRKGSEGGDTGDGLLGSIGGRQGGSIW